MRFCLALSVAIGISITSAADWNRFRGPNGAGVGAGTGYPSELSLSKNVLWKAAAPFGQSSPIIAGNRLFVTASEGDNLLTICFDARSGAKLWTRTVKRERNTKTFKANDSASPTPAADENGVYSFFADYGLVAYTLDGKDRWTLKLGPFKNFYGMASSPILAGDLIVLQCDQNAGSYLVALDRKTGQQRWKTQRPGAGISWSTPALFANGKELIVLGTSELSSYYLATGERRWWLPVGSMGAMGTPLVYRDTVLSVTAGTSDPWLDPFQTALSKYDKDKDGLISHQEFLAFKDFAEHFGWLDANEDEKIDAKEWDYVRMYGMGEFGAISVAAADAKGKVEPSAVRWRFKKNLPYIPSGLVYNDVYYMVRDGGIITSLDPATGALLKEGRSKEALGEYYSSPVAADGKIYVINGDGKASVLKAGAQWEVLGVHDLGEEVRATPALDAGRVFVRTKSAIYCFGGKS